MEVPEFFHGSYCAQFSAEKHHSLDSNKSSNGGDHFIVEELLDFSNEDAILTDAAAFDDVTANSTDSSTVTVVDSCNSSSFSGCGPNFPGENNGCRNFSDAHFSGDLCVPVIHYMQRILIIIIIIFSFINNGQRICMAIFIFF